MTEHIIDIVAWHTERCMSFKPIHFILASTPITTDSQLWIYNKLKGRFCLVSSKNDDWNLSFVPAFEDPQEAILYELTWS